MLTRAEVEDLVDLVSYKKNTGFRVDVMGSGQFVQHWQQIPDCKAQNLAQIHALLYLSPEPQYGRKWYISPHMTGSEVIQTCLMAVIAFEEHEARESFTVAGAVAFGPHIDVDQLISICDHKEVRVNASK